MPSHNHFCVYNGMGSQALEDTDNPIGAFSTSSYTDLTYAMRAAKSISEADKGLCSHTGQGQAHNNMPPYLAVYMYKRIS